MKPNGKGTRVDTLVMQYVQLRDKIAEIKEAQKKHLEPYEEMKQQLVGTLLKFLETTGQESAKTAEGTVYISTRSTAALADPDAFMDFVIEHGKFDLVNRVANAPACLEHAKENDGVLPPGVKINTIRTIGVRS
jgi:hypothetical protein